MRIKSKKSAFLAHLLLIILVAVMFYPILFAVANSFKTQKEIYGNVLSLLPKAPTIENYITITTKIPYFRIVANTLFIAVIVMVFKVFTGFIAAYAFVYLNFPGKKLLYFIFISTMFIPFTVTMIPNYITISGMGMLDSVYGVLLPQLSDAMGIFLLRQQMRSIPPAMIEVARLEKTPHRKIMASIVLPVIRPAVVSTAIIFFINSWNEYVWPRLILKSEEVYTLSLALQKFVGAEGSPDMAISMAMATATMIIPLILFACCQKYIMSTFASSGMKG
ncbi:carbohydrate ABC transporter permease [Diplocloster modestus]|uniref:Carbohydrate ABC transporter permease n=1 Tax=Diplocloster modestus TaxID=2850322 RepID=A0ABS6K4R3_9FIRM|nr:carbohydrate ABC transporter permease [Diplocloster modestus]MBU9725525.1 carbohydrate ABC transporter permease [Diplocloster modestus]